MNNLKLLKNLIKLNGHFISFSDLSLRFLSDPEQSMLAFSNTCDYFDIKNLAIEVPINSLSELPEYFIAQIKNNEKENLILIMKVNDKIYWTKDDDSFNLIEKSLFFREWTGIIFAIEANNKKKINKFFLNYKTLISSCVFLLLSIFLIISRSNEVYLIIESTLICLGTILSALIISEKYLAVKGENKFCRLKNKSNCKSVINSEWSKIFSRYEMADLW